MKAPAGLLIVSGLRREAAIFAGPGARAIYGDAATLRVKLAELATPPSLVMSVGICGALDPALRRGDIVLGTEVITKDERLATDSFLRHELARHLELAGRRSFLGSFAAAEAPVLSAEAKAKLRAKTGAIAVDMESSIAAHFAAVRGVPFGILRAVCDAANRDLPTFVAAALSADGRVNITAVLAGLIQRPGELPLLLAAARDSYVAFRALRCCRGLPGLFHGVGSVQLR